VPTRAPWRSLASVSPWLPMRASRVSSRRQTAGKQSRLGTSVGMSLTLCTARSICSSSSASSSSLINTPLPPICEKGACVIRSPVVLMTTISVSTPVAWKIRLRTYSACHLASRLPRVPMRTGFTGGAPFPAGIGREWLRRSVFCGANLFPPAGVGRGRAEAFRAIRP